MKREVYRFPGDDDDDWEEDDDMDDMRIDKKLSNLEQYKKENLYKTGL